MGDWFVLLDLTLLGGQCPSVGPGRTHDAATRTGLLVGDFVGLLLQEQFERPFGQTLSSHSGDLLKRAEVHIEPRPGIPERSLGDDFGPPTSEWSSWSSLSLKRGVVMAVLPWSYGEGWWGFPTPNPPGRQGPNKPRSDLRRKFLRRNALAHRLGSANNNNVTHGPMSHRPPGRCSRFHRA